MASAAPRPLLLGFGWPADEPGGLNRYLGDLLKALGEEGVRAQAVVAGPATGAPPNVRTGGRQRQPLPLRLPGYAIAARAAGRDVTVVDAHFALYARLPLLLPSLRRRPLVVHFHGPWADESRAEREVGPGIAVKRAVERSVYRRAERLVVLSAAFKQVLVERYGISPWRIDVVPPGVDLDAFSPGDRVAARRRLGLPAEGPVVVAARRLVARTGVHVLLEAWASLVSSGQGGLLVLSGDGPERAALEQRAAQLEIGPTVRFLGEVQEDALRDCYRAADVSVVPSVALEGFGLSVIESLACGTPVVVTDVGGLPEVVAALDRSLVVPPNDADALATRLAASLAGQAPTPAACRSHAERFSWASVAARHRELYALGARQARRRVVFLDHTADLSGGELALLRLIPALEGVDAHVVLAEDGPLAGRLREHGVSCEVLPMAEEARSLRRDRVRPGRLPLRSGVRSAAHVLRLARRLRQLRPDLVHTNSLKAAVYGGLAGRLARVPVVWHVRDRIDDDYLPRPAVRMMRALARRLPSAVIANSDATLATLGPDVAAATVVPSPVDVDAIVQRSVARMPSDDLLRIGIVGRIARWKGQHVFLEAFAAAFPHDGPRAVVVGAPLFGEEEYERELRALVTHLGLDDRVEFRGFQEDVADALSELDVLVHASVIPEPFGQVVVEGMAAGLVVVAAAAGGPARIVEDGLTGLLYEPGDVGALAAALRRVSAEPDFRRAVGRRAQAHALRYSARVVAPMVTRVYDRVLARGAG